MKTVTKFILATLLTTIITITLFGLYTLERYHDREIIQEQARLEACMRTFWQLLSDKGSDFRVADNKLITGSYVINGNNELPDRIQAIFGGVATVFMGDERVSTNVLTADGKRAVGTKLEGPAFDAVFKLHMPYRGTAHILGVPYVTAYDPITDKDGKTVGVLFVGIKESDLRERLHEMKSQITLTLFAMLSTLTFLLILAGVAIKRIDDEKEKQINFQKTLMDTIPNPIFYKDSDGRYLGCNKAFEDYVGLTQQELLGKRPHDLWPAELADSYRQQDLAMFSNPGVQSYETSVRLADGAVRDVIFNKATFSNKDGAVAGLVCVILDITDRKSAEEAINSAYHQLQDIVEFLPDATFVIDEKKRVFAWNRAIEKMTGMTKEEVMGKGDYIYSIPFYGERRKILIDLIDEDVEVVKSKYSYIHVEGRTLFAETHIPSFRNGNSCYLWGTATPLFDSQGRQVGSIESIRDITEYKRTEDEKLRLESQLAYARLMETIMIRLGHDLKTPLTPLFILLPLLKKQLNDPAQIKKIDTCIKSAASIKSLADKTGILARLSSGSENLNYSMFPLASLIDQSVEDCSHLISHKQICCRNLVDPGLMLHGVQGQLHELFCNLISNAVEFSAVQGTITISALRDDSGMLITVCDEGVGIVPDHLEHVFDEFFKADESRHNLEASGLGLSICKRIVQNHHGKIWAESPGPSKGTTIHIRIYNDQSARCSTGKESAQ